METKKKELDKRKTKPKPSLIKKFLPRRLQDPFVQKALMLVSFSLIIASLITPSFTSPKRSYQLGDIADRNIKNKRDILIEDVNVVQSSDNVSGLFRVLASARITGVSYVDLASLFIDGAKLNGAGTGVTRSVLEAAISEMARWSKDTSVPLRIPLAAGKATEEDFRFVKLKDLPRLNSVFTGVGFEDIQLAVQSGVRKTMSGEPQRQSPMEDLIKL